jgi:hypothetical protein
MRVEGGDDMDAYWVILGIVVLGLGLVDVFLTALNYDESGFIATRLCTLQWRCIRGIAGDCHGGGVRSRFARSPDLTSCWS